MESALHPTQPYATYKKIIEEKTEPDKASEKDRLISDLNGDPRYEALKEHGARMIRQLETMQGMIGPDDTPETIGYRFLACSVAATKIRELLDLPQNIVASNNVNAE